MSGAILTSSRSVCGGLSSRISRPYPENASVSGTGTVSALSRGYRILSGIFHCRPLQKAFSTLHPWIAFRLGNSWSKRNRLKHKTEYVFKGEKEPLWQFAEKFGRENGVDYFIFGHFHCSVDVRLSCGARFIMVKDWFRSSPYLVWDCESLNSAEFPAKQSL